MIKTFQAALQPTDIVIGGGNVKKLKELPPDTRAGDNDNAFAGGFRLWEDGGTIQTSAHPTHGAGKAEAPRDQNHDAEEPESPSVLWPASESSNEEPEAPGTPPEAE